MTLRSTNPLLTQYEWKFKSLSIEEKLKKEKLKPKVNINYNFLSESISENANTNFSMNNYKWGLDFSFPILLRQGRGDLKLTRIKILETELELQQKTQDVTNKVRLLFETADILINQLTIARSNQKNYETLLFGERDKFFSGESSLFMVNQREQQFAESQFKVVDIQYKSQITANELSFQLGIIE
jgi:outer membrane protein TolC